MNYHTRLALLIAASFALGVVCAWGIMLLTGV